MFDKTSAINPIIQVVALGSLQIALGLIRDFDPSKPMIDQAVSVPHPLLKAVNRLPVLMPTQVEVGGINVRAVMVTFSKTDDDLKIDVSIPANPVILIAVLQGANGEEMVGLNRYSDDPLDDLEEEFVVAMEQVRENLLVTFGSGELDEETKVALQAA